MPQKHRTRSHPRKPCRCPVEKSYLIVRVGRLPNRYARIQNGCPHRRVVVDYGNIRTVDPRRVREDMARYHAVLPSRLRNRSAEETPSDDDLDAASPISNRTTRGGRRISPKPNLSDQESRTSHIKTGCGSLWDPKEPQGGGGLAMTQAREAAEQERRIDEACRKLLQKVVDDDE